MRQMKTAFLVVFYIIISGCASNAKYDKMMTLEPSQKTGMTSIEKGKIFVIFDLKKDKSFKIISVKTSIKDKIVEQINTNNKDSKNNLRSCIQLNPSDVCTPYIEPNIYLKKKSTGVLGTIFGVVVSPLSLTIDALDVATGQKPTSTKNSFVKNTTDKSLVEKVASHIDQILYEEYNTSKQSGSLSKLLSKYDLPTIQQRENDKIKARRIAKEKAEKLRLKAERKRKEKIRLKKKAEQDLLASYNVDLSFYKSIKQNNSINSIFKKHVIAYLEQGHAADLKAVQNNINTDEENSIFIQSLFEKEDPNKFVTIKFNGLDKTKLKTTKIDLWLATATDTTKEFIGNYEVSIKEKLDLPKNKNYSLSIKFTLIYNLEAHSLVNSQQKVFDFDEVVSLKLTNTNQYKKKIKVDFGELMINREAGVAGLDSTRGYKLKDVNTKFDVLSIKVEK